MLDVEIRNGTRQERRTRFVMLSRCSFACQPETSGASTKNGKNGKKENPNNSSSPM
jgi:hypothetical protein